MKLDASTLKSRIADVEKSLTEQRLKGLVVYATGSALGPSSRTHGYMRYLCDWDSHHAPSVLLLRPGLDPVLLVPNVFMVMLAQQNSCINDVRFIKITDFARELSKLFSESSRTGGEMGLVGRNEIPVPVWEGLKQELPNIEWKDCTRLLDERRVVKDAQQLLMHERAAEICDEMFATLAREIRTPKPAYQLQADMERTARYAGSEYCMTWLTVMPKADYARFFKDECQRVPQIGDQVFAGIYMIHEGHWGHAIRSGTYGAPNDTQRKMFDIALEMEDAMLGLLTPGRNLFELQAEAERIIYKHYPKADEMKVFRHRHGHALGLSYEDPIASIPFPQLYDVPPKQQHAPIEITPGMLFELHPNLWVPGEAGGIIGDMVTVTPEGPRILNRYPRELISW